MIVGTLSRYFAMRFLASVVGSLIGVIALAAMIDYVELMRRGADWPNATAWLLAKISMYRVPQLTERILPFTVLVGAMSCYLTLSRRHELVVARAAGVSAWQFVAPAVVAAFIFGLIATTLYNPVSAMLHERSKRLEADMQGDTLSALHQSTSGFWVRQKSNDGAAIINALTSREQGARLGGVSVYTFDNTGRFQERIEANSAALEEGYWLLEDARIYAPGKAPDLEQAFRLPTNLTLEQVRESFATPETVAIADLHRACRSGGSARRRLPPAIPAAFGATLSARRYGYAGRFGEPALLPVWGRAEDGFKRHRRRVPSVRTVEDHGGHE
jgi:lipopolysaccharide export system permease protein